MSATIDQTQANRRTFTRYKSLLGRVQIDLRLTHDAARSVGLEFKRLARIKRAMREVSDELDEISGTSEAKSGAPV